MSLYYTRGQWGSNQTDPPGRRVGRRGEVWIHHTWKPHVSATATHADERATVRGIQRFHVNDRGWDDIGYSFLVCQSGRAYEGRGWGRSGAHAVGHNDEPSICFVINGDEHEPTEAAWDTTRALCRDGIDRGALTPDYEVFGHTDDAAKSCPGVKTYPLIRGQLAPSALGDDMTEEQDARLRRIEEALGITEVDGKGRMQATDDAPGGQLGWNLSNWLVKVLPGLVADRVAERR